ncbi:hypothetical protein GGR53DRAFT_462646 [Hypoxylon sp. FL1150]|nr:hypothetical protein GGR53DRAFT_462646 [Hypoxylon sp. FL1150]
MKPLFSILVGATMGGVKAMAASNLPDTVSVLPNGYTVVPFSMSGAIEPGGENLTFNGTVNSIFAQIQKIKPDFHWTDFQPARQPTREQQEKIICNIPNVDSADRFAALTGYDYLKTIDQPCEIDRGPRKCVLLYCYLSATIWLCNDSENHISLSCADLGDYVLDLIADLGCAKANHEGEYESMQGQLFDTSNYNIIIGGSQCY